MINLLTPRKSTRTSTARTFLTRAAERLAGVVAEFRPASVAQTATQPAEMVTVAIPADLAPVDVPELADIETAAKAYAHAVEQAREADRAKRKARKTLDGLQEGVYGGWRIFRKPSARVTPDMEKITAIFEAHGLGDVPTRPVADSLVVERVAAGTPAALVDQEFAALAGAR